MENVFFIITKVMVGTALLSIAVYFINTIVTEWLAGWRARRAAFEAHIKLCELKHTEASLLKQSVLNLETQMADDSCQRRWLGDCVVLIAAKMSVNLPDRPA